MSDRHPLLSEFSGGHFEQARDRIRTLLEPTPLERVPALDAPGAEAWWKLEVRQPTGSFKVRGAASKLLSLSDEERGRGVVAVSTGNHGRAVAWVAARHGIPATVCLSHAVPANKVAALRELGAEVVIHGHSQDDAEVLARELAEERGLAMVHPFDDREVVLGQGTLALEVLEQLPDVATVVVPISGGGLGAGIALALASRRSRARLVGVSMTRGAAMHASLEAGRPVDVEEVDTLADSLRGGIGLDNRYTFEALRELMAELHLVEEDAILDAMRWAHEHASLRLEGAAAVGLAAARSGMLEIGGGPMVFVLSGENVDDASWARVCG